MINTNNIYKCIMNGHKLEPWTKNREETYDCFLHPNSSSRDFLEICIYQRQGLKTKDPKKKESRRTSQNRQ